MEPEAMPCNKMIDAELNEHSITDRRSIWTGHENGGQPDLSKQPHEVAATHPERLPLP
jgi:hypothetical protein